MDSSKKVILIVGFTFLAGVGGWFSAMQQHRIDEDAVKHALAAGIELFKQEKFEEAIDTLQGVPGGSTLKSKALYYEGSAQLMLRDFDAGFEKLQEAQSLTPMDPQVLFALGVATFKRGNIKLARGYFNSVLAINPMDEHERELWDQARGLVDIMARIEREAGSTAPPPAHASSLPEAQPPESTAITEDEDGTRN